MIAASALAALSRRVPVGHITLRGGIRFEPAHHASGTVTRVEWINPHTWIHLDVKDASGKVIEWMIEGGTPNTLLRRGVDKNSLPAGTEIVVEGYRAKNGTNRANGRDLTLPNGRKLFLGSSGTGAPADGKDPGETK